MYVFSTRLDAEITCMILARHTGKIYATIPIQLLYDGPNLAPSLRSDMSYGRRNERSELSSHCGFFSTPVIHSKEIDILCIVAFEKKALPRLEGDNISV